MTQTANINEQRVSAVQDWKSRMATAKGDRPPSIGKQLIIEKVVEYNPELDRLTNSTRWHNAWNLRVADPELTLLVERAVAHFKAKAFDTTKRLRRLKLKKVQ